MIALSPSHRLYLFLVATFLCALLIADCTAGKFFTIYGLEVSVGVLPFPITFLLTDVVNEYYGRKGAELMTKIGAVMMLFAFFLITIARALPAAEHSPVPQAAFDSVFGLSYRFFGASLGAYLLGQIADVHTFHLYKRLTNSRHLWLRATGSTAISQVVDTVFVNYAALAGKRSVGEIGRIVVWSYLYKMVAAVALTPLCYLAHELVTGKLGIAPAPVEGTVEAGEEEAATESAG